METATRTSDVSTSFLNMQESLALLIRGGYVENSPAIRRVLSEAVADDLWLRHFVDGCLHDPNHRKLCSSQSFPVYVSDTHAVRLNLWFPVGRFSEEVNRLVDEYFSIDVCHNHSFDFFTVGALGPGYETTFHEARELPDDPEVGREMDFARTWSFRLEREQAVFVPAGTHFHVQHAPAEFSMSLNLIPSHQTCGTLPQIILGSDHRTIDRVIRRE